MPLDHSRSRFARAADARRAAVGILDEPASMTLPQIRARYPIAARILRRLLREHALPENAVATLSTSALESIEDGWLTASTLGPVLRERAELAENRRRR